MDDVTRLTEEVGRLKRELSYAHEAAEALKSAYEAEHRCRLRDSAIIRFMLYKMIRQVDALKAIRDGGCPRDVALALEGLSYKEPPPVGLW